MILTFAYCVYAGLAIITLKHWLVLTSDAAAMNHTGLLRAVGSVSYFTTLLTGLFYVTSFIFYLYVLKRTSLSILLPLQMIVLTTLGAFYDSRVSKHSPSILFFLGIVIVMIGFALVVRYLPH